MNHLENISPKRNRWYWYLLVFGLSYLIANIVGSIPLMVLIFSKTMQSGDAALQPQSPRATSPRLAWTATSIWRA